jgi:hypothetical protein
MVAVVAAWRQRRRWRQWRQSNAQKHWNVLIPTYATIKKGGNFKLRKFPVFVAGSKEEREGEGKGKVNLEEPIRVASPTRINSFLRPSFCLSVRAKRGIE